MDISRDKWNRARAIAGAYGWICDDCDTVVDIDCYDDADRYIDNHYSPRISVVCCNLCGAVLFDITD